MSSALNTRTSDCGEKAGETCESYLGTSAGRQGNNDRLLIRSRVRFLDLYQEKHRLAPRDLWYVISGWPERWLTGLTCEESKTDITL
jgi:hypothetical protein